MRAQTAFLEDFLGRKRVSEPEQVQFLREVRLPPRPAPPAGRARRPRARRRLVSEGAGGT